MKNRKLGRTGLSVSELCFGTMNFGWTIDREAAFALLDSYRAAGGAFLQAVHVCPDLSFLPETFKAPEEWVGEWLRTRVVPRSEVILSTRLTLLGAQGNERASFAKAIRLCCEASLRRMGVPYLDLLVCEWSRDLLPVDDALRAFDTLIEAGFVRHVAVANVPLWRMMEAIARAAARNRRRFEALQAEYSALSSSMIREETQELCESYKLGLLVTSALGGGPMGLRRHDEGGCQAHDGRKEEMLRKLSALAAVREASIEQVALAWVLSHRHVSSVVVSANSPEQLTELVRASSWDLAADPGGESLSGPHGEGQRCRDGYLRFSHERLQVPLAKPGGTK